MKKIISLLLLCGAVQFSFAQLKVANLLTENRINPVGIDAAQPRFTWQLASDLRNTMQAAYEIMVSTAAKKVVWKSGKVNSDSSVRVAYKGAALQSGIRYIWQVRVWDDAGNTSAWSEPAFFQTALLYEADGKAKWIEAGFEEYAARPALLFRRKFDINKKITSAVLYITAHGMYEAQINGQRVGDAYLAPGWTSYNKRLQYQMYDVTKMLNTGSNAIGAMVGNGWYRGYLAWENNKDVYGKKLGLLVQLNITYSNGTSEVIISDEKWKSSVSAIESVEIYHGETYDARDEKTSW